MSTVSSSFVMTSIIPLFALLLIPGVGLLDSSASPISAFAQKYGDSEIPNMEDFEIPSQEDMEKMMKQQEVSGKYTNSDVGVEVVIPDGWSGMASDFKDPMTGDWIAGFQVMQGGLDANMAAMVNGEFEAIALSIMDKQPEDTGNDLPDIRPPPSSNDKEFDVECSIIAAEKISVNGKNAMKMEASCEGSDVSMQSRVYHYATVDDRIISYAYMTSPASEFDKNISTFENSVKTLTITNQGNVSYDIPQDMMIMATGATTANTATNNNDINEEESQMEKISVGNIDVTMSPPIEGSEDAPITIIEFGDFQCPKCDQWFQNEKPTIKQDYIDTGKVNLYFVDFTVLGDDSMTAANASYCAEEQGKYWEFHSHLYNSQGGINEGWASSNNLKMFASELGLDVIAFDECLDSGKYDDKVSYNTSIGASNGVEGTPAFFIVDNFDGATERIDGPQSSDIFAGVIDEMLGDPVEPASGATEEEITEMASGIVEQAEDMAAETENQIEETAEDMAAETENQIEETAEDMAAETENQIEETAEDIGTAIDERPKVNIDAGDDGNNIGGGGGCLIATAAYGTEMAPQVQFLREIRDNTVMSTTTGASFMTGFNQLYYSFSPTIADMERENPMFQEAVRAFITPMISTLSIMTLAEEGSEAEVLGLGISVIALNLGIYIAAPAAVGFTAHIYVKSRRT